MTTTYTRIDSRDVARIIDRIENVIEGEGIMEVSAACIVVAILAQNPKLDPEKLGETVKGVSEYLAAVLAPGEVVH